MAAADGTSEVRDAAELRVKESDRISRVGAACARPASTPRSYPTAGGSRAGSPREARRSTTQGDHRIAIALAVAG